MSMNLTPRQADTLAYIRRYVDRAGCAPSYAEIAAALGLSLKSKSSVHRLLSGLEERGAIRRLPDRARAIEIVENDGLESLPDHSLRAMRDRIDAILKGRTQ